MPTIFILLYHSHLSLVCDALYSLFLAVAARSAAAARALKNFLKKKKKKNPTFELKTIWHSR